MEEDTNKILIRYTVPNRYDTAPFGAMAHVSKEDGTYDSYLQTSTDETNANWCKLGLIFEKAFNTCITDPMFIEECLHLFIFPNKKENRYHKLSEILKNK